MIPAPYIGITDFTSEEEVRSMLEVFNMARLENDAFGTENTHYRRLMVGVMMSYKTLNGLPTKWSSVFPDKEKIASIFIRKAPLLNTLHYADYDGIDVIENLLKATNLCGKNLNAIQLDMVWPEPDTIKEYRHRNPQLGRLIIQVNKVALEQISNNPELLIQKLRGYGDSIDYALLDKSMGRGLGMDAAALRPFVRELSEHMPELGIAVAGGLGPKTMHLVEGLAKDFPHISIDAQGQLRHSGSALDPIDWDMAAEYIRQAVPILK